MSSSIEAQPPEEPHDVPATTAAFPDDTGELPLDIRRVVVQLLLGPALDANRQSKLWPVLLRHERQVRARLHELFLELVIDRAQRVAFTKQVTAEDTEIPILLRKAKLTFVQSALLLFLREQLIHAETRDERAVISRDDMLRYLSAFEAVDNRDRARFGRQSNNAVERIKELNLIRKLRSSDERYEVSPTLKLLFRAEEIQELTRTYEGLLAAGAADETSEDDTPGNDGEEDAV